MNFYKHGGIIMRKKIGLICLSAMLITLAVGYSSNTTESIRANATAKKSNSEQKREEKEIMKMILLII